MNLLINRFRLLRLPHIWCLWEFGKSSQIDRKSWFGEHKKPAVHIITCRAACAVFAFVVHPTKKLLWMGCLLLKLECKPCTHEWYQWKQVIKIDEAFPIPTSIKWLLFFRVLEQAMILQCLVIKIILVKWLMFKVTVAYNQSRSDSLVLPGAKIVAS